jgi:subfamily B ATP-binding cassette protein MsbA
MRQLTRIVRYVLPYSVQLLAGIILLAGVGFLEAFRLILIKPILDQVLKPAAGAESVQLFTIPGTHRVVYLQESCRCIFTAAPGRSWPTLW